MVAQPRPGSVGRVVLYDDEAHFIVPPTHVLAVGDVLEVIRGNGLREGTLMGRATVTELDEDGAPVLDIRLRWQSKLEPDGSS